MPKIKTVSAAKKRFRMTGSGKIRRAQANMSHILDHKPSKRTRKLRKMALVDSTKVAQIKRMLVE